MPEVIVVNADGDWDFRRLVRSHSLDLYDPDAGVEFWDSQSSPQTADDRAFWGTWPVSAGERATALQDALDLHLRELFRVKTHYLSVLFVVDEKDLFQASEASDEEDWATLSASFLDVLSVLRYIHVKLSDQTRNDIGTSNPDSSRLWVSFAVRKGGMQGAMGNWARAALSKINARICEEGGAILQGVQFLSITEDEDKAARAALTHFRKLRILIDVMRQHNKLATESNGRYRNMWALMQGPNRVHQIVMRDDGTGPWSDSDILRYTIEDWHEGQKRMKGKELKLVLEKLKERLSTLKQQAEANPDADEENTNEVQLLVQDRIDEDYTKLDVTLLDTSGLAWKRLPNFMWFRRKRVQDVERLDKSFLEQLRLYHNASRSVQPKLLAEMRDKQLEDRTAVVEALDELETGVAEGVLASLVEEADKISGYRESLTKTAAKLRKNLADGFHVETENANGDADLVELEIENLPAYATYTKSVEAAKRALSRLSMPFLCFLAFVLSVVPVTIFALMLDRLEIIRVSWPPQYMQVYLAALTTVVVGTIYAASSILSSRAQHAFDEMTVNANQLIRNVKNLPYDVFRYARATGNNASYRIIEEDLRDRSRNAAERVLDTGIRSFDTLRTRDKDALTETESYQKIKQAFTDKRPTEGYHRPYMLISRTMSLKVPREFEVHLDHSFQIGTVPIRTFGVMPTSCELVRL